MPTKAPQLLGSGDVGAFVPQDPIGFLDVIGHSGIADAQGVTSPDFGPAHTIDQYLQPAIYRSCAMGSAVHSWHNAGNGTNGDGGWAHALTEFDRQEEISGFPATTLSALASAGATSITPTSTVGLAPNQWIVVGTGANCEIVQISGAYAGGSPVPLQPGTSLASSKASGDPMYYALRNVGGYLPKSSVVLLDTGGNDVPYLGMRNTIALDAKVFGTNAGAARGLDPFKHALRFTIAQMRCSVIFKSSHVNNIYAGTWSQGSSASVIGLTTASNPPIWQMGGGNGLYNYCTANGGTVTFTTPPDFPGGTVVFFSQSYYSPSGAGCVWSFTVDGSAAGSLDTRNQNAVNFNDAAAQTTAKATGVCFRLTGLTPGRHTIVATVGSLSTYGVFLGWGIEANPAPLVVIPEQFRLSPMFAPGHGYGVWSAQPYYRRSFAGAQTATVSAGAGTGAGSVTLGSAITAGAAGTGTNTQVYPGDTITIGTGTTQETRRIVAIATTTTLSVDANFVFAHTGETCTIGFQDADFVGGGWANPRDTQGATSVPGLNGVIRSLVTEFDSSVVSVDLDTPINGGKGVATSYPNPNLAADGVHYSNGGAPLAASAVLRAIWNASLTIDRLSRVRVPNKRTWIPIYGEASPASQQAPGAGAQAIFANSWQNLYPFDATKYRSGFYKDARTRMVFARFAITGGTDNYVTVLPLGYRPMAGEGRAYLDGYGSAGPARLVVNPDGTVTFVYGYPGATADAAHYVIVSGVYLPEFI